jgi:UDP-N-acetylglucosamine 4,6-dehydratase/5-epimerase|tara:strand:+ start:35 stop:991 length:957 start_codon:yes stop_codon:yes gene_type:complete
VAFLMNNKKILIFGGAGALGKTLIKRYYEHNEIIVFSRDEHKHYNLLKEYPKVKSIIGDIKDKDSINNALLKEKPNIVINAAALKHVPICEDNPYESVKTNIIGHQNLIECVSLYNIETLIFVSTDKACKPINVYGMCKAISEQLYISFAKQQDKTKVVIVRYGNVLESTGSVIPFFKDLLDDSNTTTLPITHSEMTRFLLTLEQATDLIHWAYSYDGSHGKIAVPKVKSLKVTDVANALIKSYKRNIDLIMIGIRPGEKLHEEMVSSEEWRKTEELENFFLIGNNTINDEQHSYNSLDYLMDSSDAYKFLKESGVIK